MPTNPPTDRRASSARRSQRSSAPTTPTTEGDGRREPIGARTGFGFFEAFAGTVALGATLVASYTCDFAVTPDGQQVGVWRYQGLEDGALSDQCTAWVGHEKNISNKQETIILVLQVLTICVTVVGTLVWICHAALRCQDEFHQQLSLVVETGGILCIVCTVCILILFLVGFCSNFACESSWGAVSAGIALVCWLVFIAYIVFDVESVRGATQEDARSAMRQQQGQPEEGHRRRTGGTLQGTSTVCTCQRRASNSAPSRRSARPPHIWKDENGKMKKSTVKEYRDAQGTRTIETYIETLEPVGTPLITTQDNDDGTLVRTILQEYQDSKGNRFANKVVEQVNDVPEDEESQTSGNDVSPPTPTNEELPDDDAPGILHVTEGDDKLVWACSLCQTTNLLKSNRCAKCNGVNEPLILESTHSAKEHSSHASHTAPTAKDDNDGNQSGEG